ncbi:MAG: peptidase dimerization domain-containing protein [Gemmatimonadota bacterium]|nr:peptidase dimerization domain-containing protein [Gemmatimonadota bacterium]MDH5758575.1 peptidase dimerization domain-containing protein [Gemmatimonadota bacterium]
MIESRMGSYGARVAMAWVALGLGLPVAAQTTPTERAAAAEVLERIAALQGRIRPSALGARLAERGDAGRDEVLASAGRWWDAEMEALSDHIGRNPEVGWQEHASVDTLVKVLRHHGFTVETGVAGLETAFLATWDSPAGSDGPTLGLIGEYDALRDVEGPFHGDQHNAQTPVALAAALALKDRMTGDRIPGRIRVYGTPAEEVGPPAKTIMYEAGVFQGADVLVRSHSSNETARARAGFGVCCLNINEVRYVFTGRPAHQLTSWNGRNALEAAVRFYTSVNGLRSTFRPEASIQGVIPEGGVAPNVVPARAVVDYYIRYPDEVYLEHMTRMIDDAARGAALATGTEVAIDRYGEFRDGITLGSMEELYFAYARKLGAPRMNEEPQRPAGYEETGWVTREIPGVGVSVYSSTGTYHTKEMEADGMGPVGHTGFRLDAQIMAAILYDYLTDSDLRDVVAEEHGELQGLLSEYHRRLREVYAPEVGGDGAGGR